jgi:DNA-binding response OmpR family regulator
MRIIIIEDESIVALEIARFLRKSGHELVGTFGDGETALAALLSRPADVAVVDITLQGKLNGIETARRIKQTNGRTAIIYLTAHTDENTMDDAIDTEPVAYLAKPFRRNELKAALKIAKASTQKVCTDIQESIFRFDENFRYDLRSHTLYRDTTPIALTPKERQLLELLITHANRLTDYYTVEISVWPDENVSADALRSLVKRLRRKLDDKFIKTITAQGFLLETSQ